jgi:hemolysin-activating ACP:hemolysin acyltransferase
VGIRLDRIERGIMLLRDFGSIPFSAPCHAAADAAAAGGATGLDADELKRRPAVSREFSTRVGEVVSLLMRSRLHRFSLLAELEWMIMPAIAARQVRIVEGFSQETGLVSPVAAILWASVSPEIDQRLNQAIDQPIKLKPEEWRSGDIVWIVEAVGEPRVVAASLQHLKQNELKDRVVRMRVKGGDGKPAVGRLELETSGQRG